MSHQLGLVLRYLNWCYNLITMAISDPNLNEAVDTARAGKAQTQGFLQGQQGQTSDFTNRFSSFVNTLPTTSQLANQFSGELNLPTLRSNAGQIQNTLSNLPSTYSSAVRGTDVNANQLQRIIAQKQAELAPAATTANLALSNAENQLGQRIGYAQADRSLQLMPYQSEQSLMSDRLARETTLFSQDKENELNSIQQKVQNGITLSEGEKQRAQQLLLTEKQYQSQKEQNRYMNVGAGGLYDTQTNAYAPGARPSLNNFMSG